MSRWTFWRKGPSSSSAAEIKPKAEPLFLSLGDVVSGVLGWLLPSSAVVVGALGQFMLALVLLMLALGVWLRLWRGRKKRRAGNCPSL